MQLSTLIGKHTNQLLFQSPEGVQVFCNNEYTEIDAITVWFQSPKGVQVLCNGYAWATEPEYENCFNPPKG